jgi:hypothetical protein
MRSSWDVLGVFGIKWAGAVGPRADLHDHAAFSWDALGAFGVKWAGVLALVLTAATHAVKGGVLFRAWYVARRNEREAQADEEEAEATKRGLWRRVLEEHIQASRRVGKADLHVGVEDALQDYIPNPVDKEMFESVKKELMEEEEPAPVGSLDGVPPLLRRDGKTAPMGIKVV